MAYFFRYVQVQAVGQLTPLTFSEYDFKENNNDQLITRCNSPFVGANDKQFRGLSRWPNIPWAALKVDL